MKSQLFKSKKAKKVVNKSPKKGKKLAIVAIALSVLIVIVSFVAWAIYYRSQNSSTDSSSSDAKATTRVSSDSSSNNVDSSKSNSQTDTTASDTAQTDPNEGYVTIDEWGVRFKPVDGLLNIVYFKSDYSSADKEFYGFSVQELVDVEPNCAVYGFSYIIRTNEPTDDYEKLLAIIDDYYYYYRGADSACSQSQNNENYDLESQQRNLLKQSQDSLEAME